MEILKESLIISRNRLYYKRRNKKGGTEKNIVTEESIKVTDKIKNTKKQILYCNDIVESANERLKILSILREEKNKPKEK